MTAFIPLSNKRPSLVSKLKWHFDRLTSQLPNFDVHAEKPYPTLSVHMWRPGGDRAVNFGDELALVVVDLMLGRNGFTRSDELKKGAHLLSVGSCLHFAKTGSVIWGAGLHGNIQEKEHRYSFLDVRAVRGPHTRNFLINRGVVCTDVFGDPGILIKRLTGERFAFARTPGRIAFVPNLHDLSLVSQLQPALERHQIVVVSPLQSWNVVVAEIARSDYVISSSLHGLIVAEAFAVPARYLRLSERESILKYQDFYLANGRKLTAATSLEEALAIGGQDFGFDLTDGLIEAFPFDLWHLDFKA